MRFVVSSNRTYQRLALIASLAGIAYLISRANDIFLFYDFVLGRNQNPHWFQRTLPFLIYAVECIFVLDHLLFNVSNQKMKVCADEADLLGMPPFITILIPTYNEPQSVVEKTVLATLAVDYPADRYEILLLDDANLEENKLLIQDLQHNNIGHTVKHCSRRREGKLQSGYKAGNLNFGIFQANRETTAFFLLDSDHVPHKTSVQSLVRYLTNSETDGRSFGFVQSPQFFEIAHPDWWDRPCREFHFYTQAYRAYNDAVMLTGTGALISAEALAKVGGFDELTVTEDILTGAKIQSAGFATYYHAAPVATGLVPDSLQNILNQRIRWAQGSFQFIFRSFPFWPTLRFTRLITYLFGVFHFVMPLPYAILALIPPFSILLSFDPSLHFTTLSLTLLLLFAVLRFLAREAFCPKGAVEKTAHCYLNLLYAPMYAFALWSVCFKRKIVFHPTPKNGESRISLKTVIYVAFPALIVVLNCASLCLLANRTYNGEYPAFNWFTDYSGITVLSAYFIVCGTAFLTIPLSKPEQYRKMSEYS